jgi:phage terminase large subunit
MKAEIKLWDKTTPVYHKLNTLTNYRFIGMPGGGRASKTVSAEQYLGKKSIIRPGSTVSILGMTYDHLSRGALYDFKKLIETNPRFEYCLKNPYSVDGPFFTKGKSKIEFIALDKPGKALGGQRTDALVNEANLQNWETIQQIIMRTSGQIILDWNPTADFWFHENILKRENAIAFISNFTHNPFCPPEQIAELKGYYQKWKETGSPYWKNMWRVYGLGLTGIPEGVCFPDIDYIDSFPPHSELSHFGYAMDWGWSPDPTTILKCGILKTGQFVGELLFYDIKTMAMEFDNINGQPGHFHRLGITKDSVIFAPDDNMDGITLLQQMGWNIIPVDRPPGSVKPGIDLLNSIGLKFVKNHLVKIIQKEQAGYRYKETLGVIDMSQPIDKKNHVFDSARYFTRPTLLNKGVNPKKARKNERQAFVV